MRDSDAADRFGDEGFLAELDAAVASGDKDGFMNLVYEEMTKDPGYTAAEVEGDDTAAKEKAVRKVLDYFLGAEEFEKCAALRDILSVAGCDK
jgi:hypothetical protein